MNKIQKYAITLNNAIKCYGNRRKNAKKLILNAGSLSMIYKGGYLRHISIQNNEIIRMIYFAVRDKDWITIEPDISDEKFDVHNDCFSVAFKCSFLSERYLFTAFIEIEGRGDSSVFYSFKGTAHTTFTKNRIGLCVLHPIESCSGETCIIKHTNGAIELSTFPVDISPHQPFTDIKSMQWGASGYKMNLLFQGDIFETEDQRNWTDASFKTYSTPLRFPFPVTLQKGEKINQKIELKLTSNSGKILNKYTECTIDLDPETVHNMPGIGINQSSRLTGLTMPEICIINRLQFNHYRMDLYLFDSTWKMKWEKEIREAQELDIPIVFGLFFSDDFVAESEEFIRLISGRQVRIYALIIFHKNAKATPGALIEDLAPRFKQVFPDTKIGCGSNANFAELNRNRPQTHKFDFLSYSIHPQEHASDNLTLIENLGAQKDTVETARGFAKGKGIWVSPVTIKRRFNANNENYEKPHENNKLPSQVDSRLMSLIGACWTVGSLKNLIHADIEGLTFFETVGERGIFQGEFPSRWPDGFPSVKGMIFPVYFVFEFVLKNKGYKVISSKSSKPLIIESLVLTDGNNLKIILVNFSPEFQKVIVSGCSGSFTMIQLNSTTYPFAVSNPDWLENSDKETLPSEQSLPLEPYSVSFIESRQCQLT